MSLSSAVDATPTIAVVSASPALASILASVLEAHKGWRIRRFTALPDLGTYMRIAPVAVIVADFQFPDGTLAGFADSLRQAEGDPQASPAILALVRAVDPALQRVCLAAGIDEVIVKPMSPAHIEERVAVHLASARRERDTGSRYNGPERRGRLSLADPRPGPLERRGDNVVSFAAHKAARQSLAAPA